MRRIRQFVLTVALPLAILAGTGAQLHAQDALANAPAVPERDASAQLPSYDVASIKPYGRSDFRISIRTIPDGVSVSGMPMHMILRGF